MTVIDLSVLPKPAVIEELNYEAILDRQKVKFQELWEAVRATRPDLPPYDVSMLETDPAMIVLQAQSFSEMLIRARTNEAARANLLAFASGSDLVHLAADHGVEKLTGESDDALRSRLVLADQASSAAGSEEWYAYHARSVSADVEAVAVYRKGTGPEIEVAILATSEDGVASAGLISSVAAVVNSPAVRAVNDVVTVVSAAREVTDIIADVWLLPAAPADVSDLLEASLRQAVRQEGGIGFDLNRSWIESRLMVPGVAKVNLMMPLSDVAVDDRTAAVLGTVTLNFRGRMR